jgi:hypothetical protein
MALVVGRAVVAVEAVLGVGVDVDLDLVVVVEAFGDAGHGRQRDVAVGAAEMHQHRHRDLAGALQRVLDAAAVVAHGRVDQAVGGRMVGQAAAEAVAERGDLAFHAVERAQRLDGGGDVRLRQGEVGGVHQFDGALPARVVIAQFDTRAVAPEQVGSDHHIAVGRVLVGHVADVLVDAENLLQQHDAGTLAAARQRHVGAEAAVGDGDIDPLGVGFHGVPFNAGSVPTLAHEFVCQCRH